MFREEEILQELVEEAGIRCASVGGPAATEGACEILQKAIANGVEPATVIARVRDTFSDEMAIVFEDASRLIDRPTADYDEGDY